jgi:NodT family efflux transporter outer membrane factor (OMF) lipoprotein
VLIIALLPCFNVERAIPATALGNIHNPKTKANSNTDWYNLPNLNNNLDPMLSPFRLRAGAAACVLALSACTTGPDFKAPATDVPVASFAASGAGDTPSQTVEQDVDPSWWMLFNDATLVALERDALAANLDLQAASARVGQSRAALRISGASLLPTVGANASGLRELASGKGIMSLMGTSTPTIGATAANGADPFGTASMPGESGSAPYTLWQYGFDASWELDLWGKAHRAQEASAAENEAAAFDAAAVRVAITAEVARTYLELRGVQSDLRIALGNIDIAKKSLHVAERRREQGVATQFDTSVSQAQLATFESAVPELERRQDALMNALALLLARPPHALDAQLSAGADADASTVPALPARVPVGLPSQLAHRRPDILRAEAQLHAATAAIGVAKAEFYPSVSLTGSAGFQALKFSEAGDWGARQFALGPVLHLPIFEGGRLKGNLALTEARQQEAAIGYQQTVLKAWHEVDDALVAYRSVQRRFEKLEVAVTENRRALANAERRYTQGAADYLSVLVTQQRLLESENAASRSRTDMAVAMVSLYKALGGGWQKES